MRRISIEELQPGLAVNKQAFLLRDKSLTATRSGSSLLRVMLGDRRSIPGIMFDAPTRFFQDRVIGKGVEVTAGSRRSHALRSGSTYPGHRLPIRRVPAQFGARRRCSSSWMRSLTRCSRPTGTAASRCWVGP